MIGLKNEMENLFVYGLLKKPEIQKKVIGRICSRPRTGYLEFNLLPTTKSLAESSEDSIKGYKLSQINVGGEIFPILINFKSPRDFVFGLVLEVSEEELKKIDKYETDTYKRKKVILSSGKESWVYVK